MRFILIILPIALVGCLQSTLRDNEIRSVNGYWVSKKLDYYSVDSAVGGGLTMYGSGYLLKLSPNGQAISLGADFYWKNDSLYQGGEPGVTLRTGDWKHANQFILLNQRLVIKTIMLTSDQIGQAEVDSILVQDNNSMIYRQDTLIFVRKPSKELEQFIDRIVAFEKTTNGG